MTHKEHTTYLVLMAFLSCLFLWFGVTTEGALSAASFIWCGMLIGHIVTTLLDTVVDRLLKDEEN